MRRQQQLAACFLAALAALACCASARPIAGGWLAQRQQQIAQRQQPVPMPGTGFLRRAPSSFMPGPSTHVVPQEQQQQDTFDAASDDGAEEGGPIVAGSAFSQQQQGGMLGGRFKRAGGGVGGWWPKPKPATCKDPNGNAPYQYDLSNHKATCADPSNKGCPACHLWTPNICKLTQRANCQQGFYSLPGGHEDLILPSHPMRGIEDVYLNLNNARAASQDIWKQAWHAGATRFSGPNVGALVINSPSYRSEHQMHIHAGNMDTTNLFHQNCVVNNLYNMQTVTSWASSRQFTCQVNGYRYDSTSGQYVPSNPVTAYLRAIVVADLSKVWPEYLAGMQSGAPVATHTAKDYERVGAAVIKAPNANGWFLILFSGKGGMGDHQILKQH